MCVFYCLRVHVCDSGLTVSVMHRKEVSSVFSVSGAHLLTGLSNTTLTMNDLVGFQQKAENHYIKCFFLSEHQRRSSAGSRSETVDVFGVQTPPVEV